MSCTSVSLWIVDKEVHDYVFIEELLDIRDTRLSHLSLSKLTGSPQPSPPPDITLIWCCEYAIGQITFSPWNMMKVFPSQ